MISKETLHAWYFEGLKTVEAIKPRVSSSVGHRVTATELNRMLRQVLPKENYYQDKIMDWVKEQCPQAFVRKITSGIYSEGGFPDILVIIDGLYYGIEVKRPYIGKTSKLQERTIGQINEAGGHAGVACFPYEAKEIIEPWTKT